MLKIVIAALVSVAGFAAGVSQANEGAVKSAVENWLGAKVDGVRKTAYLGLYEVRLGTDLIYVDEKLTYIFNGEIIEAKSRKNLTQERVNKLLAINFSDLPLDQAVKIVRGSGKRVMATFEDPNCGYCKRLAKDMQSMTDVTIYTFLFPILSQDSIDKAKSIWCSPDRAKAWMEWMVNGVRPNGGGDCANPIQDVVALGQKLGIRGTPTIFVSSGERIPGAVPVAQIEKALTAAGPRN